MSGLQPTKYYAEYLKYNDICVWQQKNCNLGTVPYSKTPFDDDLVKKCHIYDVCERKYAGFCNILLDMFYSEEDHPRKGQRSKMQMAITDATIYAGTWTHQDWLYLFMVHRLTGSGINYALEPSGYHNSVIPHLLKCKHLDAMADVIDQHREPMFTSKGYQIAPFPKPQGLYKTGGRYFLCEILPDMIQDFYAEFNNITPTFRQMMRFFELYHVQKELRMFWFQYAAFLADIADFFPYMVKYDSPFFYGKNCKEGLDLLFVKPRNLTKDAFYDEAMNQICRDTGALPYNAEDIVCDWIRWIENYIDPKEYYAHLDLDKVWNSSKILDHPQGRQKSMLDLKLVETFNGSSHPSDKKILNTAGWTEEQYKKEVESHNCVYIPKES